MIIKERREIGDSTIMVRKINGKLTNDIMIQWIYFTENHPDGESDES